MNLREASGSIRKLVFSISRVITCLVPGGRMSAFGAGDDKIGSILVVNLDRQPRRWQLVLRELGRFQASDGTPLVSIAQRLSAVDARNGRAVAATADVDSTYHIGDQLFVQPDARLAECFSVNEPIRMSRQEVAVARSHVEVWKTIATGPHNYVLVLEDDVWFERGAAKTIDRGWRAALQRCRATGGPRLLYLSYADAGGTAKRLDVCDVLFRPARGLWFLSGYVLSREGAAALLRAMPVVGPVDMWINYRFEELGALALSSPVILQRPDNASENSYSVLPFLARAGIVDASTKPMPEDWARAGPVLAWTNRNERENLAMALSMLGLRVRAFDGDEEVIHARMLPALFETFDALIDAPVTSDALSAAIARADIKFIFEAKAERWSKIQPELVPPSRAAVLSDNIHETGSWKPICSLLGLAEPAQSFPTGAPRILRIFRDDRPNTLHPPITVLQKPCLMDDSPWVLPPRSCWHSRPPTSQLMPLAGQFLLHTPMTSANPVFHPLVETFPGNLASFTKESIRHNETGTHLVVSRATGGGRPFRSGAFVSERSFQHGRFEAEIKAASGAGLVTGFFLHRDAPRQEIDVELAGNDPRRMLINVFFNPGDDGAALGFGYRGSPCRIDLGFDATSDFHRYAIDWRPGRILWSVDGRVIHERVGWDPTPIPHLPMRLHANLWVPRSEELAGRIEDHSLPATSIFRNISVQNVNTGDRVPCFYEPLVHNHCEETPSR